MKNIFMLLVACTTMVFASCSDDDAEPSSSKEEVAIMITEKEKVLFWIETDKVDVVTIDWGDGNIEKFTTVKDENEDENEVFYEVEPMHTYQNSKAHTITVKGAVFLDCSNNLLTSLDVSNCTALTCLYCWGNKLTSLDVSKCTALTELSCDGNKLTSTALNKIFTDLPQGKTWIDNSYGETRQSTVYIGENPGTETCDRSIAEKKGWKVETYN